MSTRQVAGPEPASQPVIRAIGQSQCFAVVLEGGDSDKGPEYFFERHSVGRLSAHDRWFDITALGKIGVLRSLTAGQNFAAFLPGNVDIGKHTVPMNGRCKRTHLSLGVERVAYPNRLGKRDELVEEFICDPLLYQQA